MAESYKDLIDINFNHGWKCSCRESYDENDRKKILSYTSDCNISQYWSSIELPHVNDKKQQTRVWWYSKTFDWTSMRYASKQAVHFIFKSLNDNDENVNIDATVWLNDVKIFSNILLSSDTFIEMPSDLLNSENKKENILVICCRNETLTRCVSLLISGKLVYAIGQVLTDENMNVDTCKIVDKKAKKIFDYRVTIDDGDGQIDVMFNPKRKAKESTIPSALLEQLSSSSIRENQIDELHENLIGDLLVPRLAILILIVGTRGDVQPFVALGQALHAIGHRVRLATHEAFRSFVRENGLEFYPLAGDPADLMSFMVKNSGVIPSLSSILEGDVGRKRRSIASILASTWRACTEDDDETGAPFIAEAIIANPPSFGHIHCAEKLQIPLHIMFTMPWTPTTAFPHPLANIESSIGPKSKINWYSYDVMEMLTWTGLRDIVNDFRKKTLGLKELHSRQAINAVIDEHVPHTYCWSPSLVPKPLDWGSHIDVSGFLFLDLGTTYKDPPKELLKFLGINNDGSSNGQQLPLPIYIGFGSITGHNSHRILRIVLEALKETGYRALLSGLATDSDPLPSNVFKIGNIPHDWLFQYVSAVCHHGGAGTTAAGLRAGKPTIIVPFFGDQFFWGSVVQKCGVGPSPLPGKSLTTKQLIDAFHFAHKSSTRTAAECIRDAILREDGCTAAIHAFHANLPVARMHSDLEPTFAACYYLEKYNLQISRAVAQVLVAAGVLNESELHHHTIQEWQFMCDHRRHLLAHGIIDHSQKAFSSMFVHTAKDLKVAARQDTASSRAIASAGSIAKGFGLGIGHLAIGCLSLYGEMTDALDYFTPLYDPFSNSKKSPRPRVIDFESGAKAAGLSLWNGWKNGVTGIVHHPRIGYERHGALGGAAGSLVAAINVAVKPTVGTLSSITWLSRGTYASVKKAVETYKSEGRRIATKLFDSTSSIDYSHNEKMQTHEDERISAAANLAATRSGFHPKVCQDILDEFNEIKIEHDEKLALASRKK